MGEGQDPKDYKNICTHFVFDAKHDGRHKAMLEADEHLTDVLLSNAYLGVASLSVIMLVLVIEELNDLESWRTGIDNAYLQEFTKEKVCIVASHKLRYS